MKKMNFTLHITDKCNFKCTYCRHKVKDKNITFDKVKKLINISRTYGNTTGFCFYGGEPLCAFELLEEIIEYCKTDKNHKYVFKMNSNGSLFTEDKIRYLTENNVEICLSHDGLMQKITKPGFFQKDTFKKADESAKLLLKYQPESAVQTVYAPESCHLLARSVKHLYNLGFRRILAVYAAGVVWEDKHLEILKNQYNEIADFYKKCFYTDDSFILSYIDDKINNGIFGKNKSPCHIGRGQFSVNTDGFLYPCSQFVDKKEYCLGDAESGLDIKAIGKIMKISTEPEICLNCQLRQRCRNTCGCINLSETGFVNEVSPFHCEHERMIIDLADSIAEHFYENQPQKFQKRYGTLSV